MVGANAHPVSRALPWVAALALLALLTWLGNWQLDRAEEKRVLLETYTAAMEGEPRRVGPDELAALVDRPRFEPVALHGAYDDTRQAFLDAQTHQGRAGYRVWTPLVLSPGDMVLVDRGWIAADGDRARMPDIAVDGTPRTVRGYLSPLPQPGIRLGQPDAGGPGWPRLLTWPDAGVVERAWNGDAPPVLVLLAQGEADGFVREWNPVEAIPPERHLAYAVQWFGLALALLVIIGVLVLRKRGLRDDG